MSNKWLVTVLQLLHYVRTVKQARSPVEESLQNTWKWLLDTDLLKSKQICEDMLIHIVEQWLNDGFFKTLLASTKLQTGILSFRVMLFYFSVTASTRKSKDINLKIKD